MTNRTQAPPFLDGLYGKFVEYGIKYFFPTARLEAVTTGSHQSKQRIPENSDGSSLTLNWLGAQYVLDNGKPFSDSELKLLKSIGTVLDSRYRMILDPALVDQRFELFRGLPEDRYVSAYVDSRPYAGEVWTGPDRVEDVIEVLRTTSLSTYENRRISTGTLLFGTQPDPCHALPSTPAGALRYSLALTSIRSFYRLCDGLQTLALVDQDGYLAEVIDVEQWAEPFSNTELAVPSPDPAIGPTVGPHSVVGTFA